MTKVLASFFNVERSESKKRRRKNCLHGDVAVIDKDLLGEEVSTNGGLVLVGELLVHILVHEGCLADTLTEKEKKREKKVESRNEKRRR